MKINKLNFSLIIFASVLAIFYVFDDWFVKNAEDSQVAVRFSMQEDISVFFEQKKTQTKIYKKEGRYFAEHEDKSGKVQKFLLNKSGRIFYDELKALKVIRTIDSADSDLTQYGFTDESPKFELRGGGTSYKFQVGQRNFATNEVYILDTSSQKIWMINSMVIYYLANPLTSIAHIYAFDLDMAEIDRVQFKMDQAETTFFHNTLSVQGGRLWTRVEGGKEDVLLATWMDKFSKLQILEYSDIDGKIVEPLFKVDFLNSQRKLLDSVQVGRFERQYYVKSNFMGTWGLVNTNRVQSLISEISNLLTQK